MNAKKRYDKKVRLTRILLSDYLVLKRMSQVAGVSMAVALHRLIEHIAQLPLPKRETIVVPKAELLVPTFSIKPAGTFRIRSQPTRAINGDKVGVLVIKPKGGKVNE
ncbi:hypothetical protein ES703_91046 [subsurface metagenome]